MNNPYSLITQPNPPFAATIYRGQESFFGGEAPLSEGVGFIVVLGFGLLFSVFTTILVFVNTQYGNAGEITSEHFKYVRYIFPMSVDRSNQRIIYSRVLSSRFHRDYA
jgi:hypothetical protein